MLLNLLKEKGGEDPSAGNHVEQVFSTWFSFMQLWEANLLFMRKVVVKSQPYVPDKSIATIQSFCNIWL